MFTSVSKFTYFGASVQKARLPCNRRVISRSRTSQHSLGSTLHTGVYQLMCCRFSAAALAQLSVWLSSPAAAFLPEVLHLAVLWHVDVRPKFLFLKTYPPFAVLWYISEPQPRGQLFASWLPLPCFRAGRAWRVG